MRLCSTLDLIKMIPGNLYYDKNLKLWGEVHLENRLFWNLVWDCILGATNVRIYVPDNDEEKAIAELSAIRHNPIIMSDNLKDDFT